MLLGPPVPINRIKPPPFVLIVEPVRVIPWQAPVVPSALALMAMKLFVPVTLKVEVVVKPTPPLPCPLIEVVAVTDPAAVKVLVALIPLPPVVVLAPPEQVANITGPAAVKAPPKLTPWEVVPVPPEQLANVTVPLVAGLQATAAATPWEEAPLEALLPPTVMVPVVLVIEVLAVEICTPGLVPDPPETAPVTEIAPAVVRMLPALK